MWKHLQVFNLSDALLRIFDTCVLYERSDQIKLRNTHLKGVAVNCASKCMCYGKGKCGREHNGRRGLGYGGYKLD